MSEIDEVQKRIEAAVDRIKDGLAQMRMVPEDDLLAAQSDLAEQRTTVASLEEQQRATDGRIARIEAEAEAHVERIQQEAQAQVTDIAEKVATLDLELQRLRQANDQLRASNAALRDANAAGVGEPDLINNALAAELEALRSARAAEHAEAGAILAALGPILSSAAEPSESGEPNYA